MMGRLNSGSLHARCALGTSLAVAISRQKQQQNQAWQMRRYMGRLQFRCFQKAAVTHTERAVGSAHFQVRATASDARGYKGDVWLGTWQGVGRGLEAVGTGPSHCIYYQPGTLPGGRAEGLNSDLLAIEQILHRGCE